ncbi:MAG: hypothetical protein C0582_05240 [Alphaproteobacteria bacterium]|nr:MAG: hypothetical protein C0582_05240 [Alphaproteobacteria bacterium]
MMRKKSLPDSKPRAASKNIFLKNLSLSGTPKDLLALLLDDPSTSGEDLEELGKADLELLLTESVNCIKNTAAQEIVIEFLMLSHEPKNKTAVLIHNQDKPFLVDSITNCLRLEQLNADYFFHPIFRRKISNTGNLSLIAPDEEKPHENESLIIIVINQDLQKEQKKQLHLSLEHVLSQVGLAVTDWEEMLKKMTQAKSNIDLGKKHFKSTFLSEIKNLLEWFEQGHFTFLGFREYIFEDQNPKITQKLGITKAQSSCYFKLNCTLNDEGQDFLPTDELFIITKTISRSWVHRSTPMDVIRLKKFNNTGETVGEYEFIGLLTSTAYNISIKHIPLLSQKLEIVLAASKTHQNTHTQKSIIHILETLPRDEFFQFSDADLISLVRHILQLQDRDRFLTYIRPDPLGHLISAYVYLPTQKYSDMLRQKIQVILEQRLQAHVNSYKPNLDPDTTYARISFSLAKASDQKTKLNTKELQKEIEEASQSWSERFKALLLNEKGIPLEFSEAFPKNYQLHHTPTEALYDTRKSLQSQNDGDKIVHLELHQDQTYKVKIYYPGPAAPLTELMLVFELMGLTIKSAMSYTVDKAGTACLFTIHDFIISIPQEVKSKNPNHLGNIEDGVQSILRGYYENDFLNSLIFYANLTVSQVNVFRAYFKYLKQIRFPYSFRLISSVLKENVAFTQIIWSLFEKRFDPSLKNQNLNHLHYKIDRYLKKLKSLEEDSIFRALYTLIKASLRTNHFQRKLAVSPIIIKLDCASINFLPEPKPMIELFVYHKDFEGVHLRTGKVARGGMRWSDRIEDFRTEILGLMKAQKVKNTVIIPVGAKGGFVLKKAFKPEERDEKQAFGIACYQKMIQVMIDITDNVINDKPKHPKNIVCHDDYDPYLVVAADKGTATFSDYANEIALENKFWLGDAFASGGSNGYDHKKMAITAKSAWKSVQHHFRKLGVDVQETPIDVVGIGDMSGDVFGNGMLCSDKIRLIAAFNHQHIFIDPNPDPKKSYDERQRMFQLKRSTWQDYNQDMLSKGGGIYSRSDREIDLSSQAQKALKISKKRVNPNELIKIILKAPVDLLWFGGIGTYVKSRQETQDSVNDHSNDDIRINGSDLKCTVVGEAANLGMTQLGRIEFALEGGHVNTDAIDNSAGVDCSDYEVNIKILLRKLLLEKKITEQQRNTLLRGMEEEVSELVLFHNTAQNNAISIIQERGLKVLSRQQRFMRFLESKDYLNRQLEFLPSADGMLERQNERMGLTRPEIAVLLAYGKIFTYDQVLKSCLFEQRYFVKNLKDYFPKALSQKYLWAIEEHPLKKEIITTSICNEVVNQQGPSYLTEIMSITNAEAEIILLYYYLIRDSLSIKNLSQAINDLKANIPFDSQQKLTLELMTALDYCVIWAVSNLEVHKKKNFDLETTITHTHQKISALREKLPQILDKLSLRELEKAKGAYLKKGVPEKLVHHALANRHLKYAWVFLKISQEQHHDFLKVAEIFFMLNGFLHLPWFHEKNELLRTDDPWRKKNITQIKTELDRAHFKLTKQVLSKMPSKKSSVSHCFENWKDQAQVKEYQKLMKEFIGCQKITMDMLRIALNSLLSLMQE